MSKHLHADTLEWTSVIADGLLVCGSKIIAIFFLLIIKIVTQISLLKEHII